jgi:hypothetical protein
LYWLPLGVGGHFVRLNGRAYEALAARLQRRAACRQRSRVRGVGGTTAASRGVRPVPLSASSPSRRRDVVEQTPVPDLSGDKRGVVAEGAVGSHWAGRFRIFRYEIRLWRNGHIPDVAEAVDSPVRLSDDENRARRVLDVVGQVPTPVWGRDELRTGEMWNSNAVIAWVIARSGMAIESIRPPAGGRAPGWQAGLVVARRQNEQQASASEVERGRKRPRD